MKTPSGLKAELPVIDLFQEAISMLWQKRVQVIRLFMPALALLAFIDWLADLILPDNSSVSLTAVFLLVSVALSVLLATACHQFTLLPPEQRQVGRVLRAWGRNEARYLVRALVIGVLAAVVFFLCVLLLMLFSTDQKLMVVMSALALLPALYLWGRLSITLPELALGQSTGIRRAWDMSAGNGSRLALIVIIMPLLLGSPFLLLYLADNLLLNYVAALGTYLTSLISLVTLSLSYQFLLEFFEPQGADATAQAVAESDQGFDA